MIIGERMYFEARRIADKIDAPELEEIDRLTMTQSGEIETEYVLDPWLELPSNSRIRKSLSNLYNVLESDIELAPWLKLPREPYRVWMGLCGGARRIEQDLLINPPLVQGVLAVRRDAHAKDKSTSEKAMTSGRELHPATASLPVHCADVRGEEILQRMGFSFKVCKPGTWASSNRLGEVTDTGSSPAATYSADLCHAALMCYGRQLEMPHAWSMPIVRGMI